jgi:hypothetical protein
LETHDQVHAGYNSILDHLQRQNTAPQSEKLKAEIHA